MGKAVLAGIITLAASTSLAQTDSASDQTAAGGPANLCQELLAFMTKPLPEEAAAKAASAAPAASDQAGPTQAADALAGEGAASTSEADAAGGDDAASGKAVPPQPVEQTQSAQEASGQAGPAHESPDPNAKATADGKAEGAEKTSGLSAPVPTASTSTPKDSVLSLDEAEALASANDIAACQNAARELRLAGVAMPPPLLALTALNLQHQARTE